MQKWFDTLCLYLSKNKQNILVLTLQAFWEAQKAMYDKHTQKKVLPAATKT